MTTFRKRTRSCLSLLTALIGVSRRSTEVLILSISLIGILTACTLSGPWSGRWVGTIKGISFPEMVIDIKGSLTQQGQSLSGAFTVRQLLPSQGVDITIQGTLSGILDTSDNVTGSFTCTNATGTIGGSPITSCKQLATPSTTLTGQLTSNTTALFQLPTWASTFKEVAFKSIVLIKQ